MKKILSIVVALFVAIIVRAEDPGVNEKVLEAFQKTFANASEVSWMEKPNSYEVLFKQQAMQIRVNYDKEGNMLNTTRYYGEDQLPPMILSRLRAKFAGKNVSGVTEFTSDQGTFYYINVDDAKTLWQLKADAFGSISIEKKFRKS